MTGASKPLAFDTAARTFRDGGITLRDEATLYQLASIGGASLAAPPGLRDDRAVACVLAINALERCSGEVYATVSDSARGSVSRRQGGKRGAQAVRPGTEVSRSRSIAGSSDTRPCGSIEMCLVLPVTSSSSSSARRTS